MVKRKTNFNNKRQPNGIPSPREAMTTATAAIGRDGKGDGGLVGYFEALAMKHPKLFVGLLAHLVAYEPEVGAAEAEMIRAGSGAAKIREELLKDPPPRVLPPW